MVNRIEGYLKGTHTCSVADALSHAVAHARDTSQQIEARVCSAVARANDDGTLLTVLRVWLASPFGRHPPAKPNEKGDLVRWVMDEGMRLPTVRADLVDQAIAGKVEVRGVELVLLLATKLDASTRAGILASFGRD